jgi:hypothetical protein
MVCAYYCGISKKWHLDHCHMKKITFVEHTAVRVKRSWQDKYREVYFVELEDNIKTFSSEKEAIIWSERNLLATPVYINHKIEGKTYYRPTLNSRNL